MRDSEGVYLTPMIKENQTKKKALTKIWNMDSNYLHVQGKNKLKI